MRMAHLGLREGIGMAATKAAMGLGISIYTEYGV